MMLKRLAGLVLLLFVLSSVVTSCSKRRIVGNGKVQTETRHLAHFDAINVQGSFVLNVTQSSDLNSVVTVSADSNLLSVVQTEVNRGVLMVRHKPGVYISTQHPMVINCKLPRLQQIDVSGANEINIKKFSQPHFSFNSSGAVQVTMSGKVGDIEFNTTGVSKIMAQKLRAGNMDLKLSGSGNAKVRVKGRLTVSISGAGKVTYYGRPEHLVEHISGVSSVTQAGAS